MSAPGLTVLKLGGELVDDPLVRGSILGPVRAVVTAGPAVIVHGGGRAIDAELRARGIVPRFEAGVRITDAPTLDAVVAVLAGRINTELVASLVLHGVRAVGLTGVDAGIAVSRRVSLGVSEDRVVDLGLVGAPTDMQTSLLNDLVTSGYVPVVASLAASPEGQLLNVNADTLAAWIAAKLSATRLVVAGTTAGVLDRDGRTIRELDPERARQLIQDGGATAGMVAKLEAVIGAARAGVDVRLLDLRAATALAELRDEDVAGWQQTRVITSRAAGAHA